MNIQSQLTNYIEIKIKIIWAIEYAVKYGITILTITVHLCFSLGSYSSFPLDIYT